jgi:hypothetical protein
MIKSDERSKVTGLFFGYCIHIGEVKTDHLDRRKKPRR